MKKRLIIFTFIAVLLLALAVSADAETISGSCGTNARYSLDTNQWILRITGTGQVTSTSGWSSYKNQIKSIVVGEGITLLPTYFAYKASQLASVSLPSTLLEIGYYAFYNCASLTDINIPNKVTIIDQYAFYGCTKLTSVTIPGSVTSIGNSTFRDCSSLETVIISEGVTSIGDSAFYKCTSLTNVTIPGSVTSIGNYAFEYCNSLENVTISEGVTSIGNYAFYQCSSLTGVTIPGSVTTIGDSAFKYCSSLKKAIMHKGVTSIGENAFFECTSLTNVAIPNSVKSIGEGAFWRCRSLKLIRLPNSITRIEDFTFADCDSLKTIDIPKSVKYIGICNFMYSTPVTDIYYGGSQSDWSKINTTENDSNIDKATIHYNCPCRHTLIKTAKVAPTCTASGMEAYWTCILCDKLYSDSKGTKKISAPIVIPATGHNWDTATYVWSDDSCYVTATHTCRNDADHIETERVQTVFQRNENIFAYVTQPFRSTGFTRQSKPLNTICIPANTTVIGEKAFMNADCEAVIVPDTCTEIQSQAFAGCSNLLVAKVPAGTVTAEDAFVNTGDAIITPADEVLTNPSIFTEDGIARLHELYGRTIPQANHHLEDKLVQTEGGLYSNGSFGVKLDGNSTIVWIALLDGSQYSMFGVKKGMGWMLAQATLGGFGDWGWTPINGSPDDNLFINSKYPERMVMFTKDNNGKVESVVYGLLE